LHLAAQRMAPLVGQRLAARSHAPHAPRGLAEGVDGHVLDSARAHGKHLLDRGRLALHPVLSRLGPDLLDDDPRIADAVARARSRSPRGRPIGEVLLDQTVAAGIGNVVRCEALHALRLDPWAPLERLSDTTVAALFEQSRHLLQAGVRVGGALPRAVYGRRICPRCGAVVTRRAQGDEARTVHWCAACQSLQSD
jgi:endonuclease-8